MRLLKDRAGLSAFAFAALVFACSACQALIDLVLLKVSREMYVEIQTPATRMYYFLAYVMMPLAAFLVVRFYRRAETVFERIYAVGTVKAPLADYNAYLRKLDPRYNSLWLHLFILLLSAAPVAVAIVLDSNGDYAWRGLHTALRILSDAFFYVLPRYIMLLFVAKAIITALAVRRVFRWPIKVHLMHADGVGGMRPVADVCAILAKFCILASLSNVIISYIWGGFHFNPGSAFGLLIAFSPLIFLWVLHGAHVAMVRARHELLAQFDAQARPLMEQLHAGLEQHQLPAGPADELLRLDQLRAMVGRMPTWPFNHQVALQLGLSVLLPLVLILLQVILEKAVR